MELGNILVPRDKIQFGVSRVADDIYWDFKGQELTILCVLNGGIIFTADLVRQLPNPIVVDFCKVGRYGNDETGGEAVWTWYPNIDNIKDKIVIVCDDIFDEGITINAVVDWCQKAGAKHVATAVAFDKRKPFKTSQKMDYVACKIEDKFVFGYGLDLAGLHRNLPDLRYKE